MGQKTHPLKFRLTTTQQHQSTWCTKFNTYPVILEQDLIVRNFLTNNFNHNNISQIHISRKNDLKQVLVSVYTPSPWSFISYGLVKLESDIQQLLDNVSQVKLNLIEISESNKDANLIASYIVDQLAKRVAFKRVMRTAIKKFQVTGNEGIKIEISGRLNGAEMARSEWLKEGRMPLQTLRAKIDFSSKKSKTIYGIMGVKVWVFKGNT